MWNETNDEGRLNDGNKRKKEISKLTKSNKNNKKSSTKLNRDDIAFFYKMDFYLPALSYLLLLF